MAVVSINYDEGNKKDLGYKSVELYIEKDNKKLFDSGNFEKDWFDMIFHWIKSQDSIHYLVCSSSVDHFIMDGALFDSVYLKKKEKTTEWYFDSEYEENAMEFFVKKGTKPTWKEFKKLYLDEIHISSETRE